MAKWLGVVLVAIPVFAVSIICYITARKSQHFKEEDRAIAHLANLTLAATAASGCTDEEIYKLKKAFLKTRQDKKYLHEHNALLEQQKDTLKAELLGIKDDLGDYKDQLKKERDRFEDECPQANRTKSKSKKKANDAKIAKILLRVKDFQKHHKSQMERKDKEITDLKMNIENAKKREHQLQTLVKHLKKSCPSSHENRYEDDYDRKHKKPKEKDEDELDDLFNDLLGTPKSHKHDEEHEYGVETDGLYNPSEREPERGRNRFGHKERTHSQHNARYGEYGRKLDSGYKHGVGLHGEGSSEKEKVSKWDISDRFRDKARERKGKGAKEHRNGDGVGHVFGEWPKEHNPDDLDPYLKTSESKDQKSSAGIKGKGHVGSRDNFKKEKSNFGKSEEGEFENVRKGKNEFEESNDHSPHLRPDVHPETRYFDGDAVGGAAGRMMKNMKEVREGRKQIKAYLGNKEMKINKESKEKGQSSTSGQAAAKGTDGKVAGHDSSKGQKGNATNESDKTDAGNKAKFSGIVQSSDGNMSVQSLSDETSGVTEVQQGAVKKFKMDLSGTKAGNGTASSKDNKSVPVTGKKTTKVAKKTKGKATTTTTKKP